MHAVLVYLFSSLYSLLFHGLITPQFSYPFFFDGHLMDFQFFAFIYYAAMNILEHVFLCTDVKISLEYTFRSRLWGHQLCIS